MLNVIKVVDLSNFSTRASAYSSQSDFREILAQRDVRKKKKKNSLFSRAAALHGCAHYRYQAAVRGEGDTTRRDVASRRADRVRGARMRVRVTRFAQTS